MHCGLMLEGSNRTTKRYNTPAFTYSVCVGVGGHFQAPARGLVTVPGSQGYRDDKTRPWRSQWLSVQ